LIYVYLGVAAVVVIAFVVFRLIASNRSDGVGRVTGVEPGASSGSRSAEPSFAGPTVSSFHVDGETASTVFDVPLGNAKAGAHLIELLSFAAVEHLRKKAAQGLPLDAVHRIKISAMRAGEAEVVGTVELPAPGQLPDARTPMSQGGHQAGLLAALNEVVADTSVSSSPSPGGTLDPVAKFVQLTGPSEARLRAAGVDPSDMSLIDLTLGLFQAGGYAIEATGKNLATAPTASIHTASKAGEKVTLVVFSHSEGDYPEVDERVFGELAVLAGQSNAQRTILMSDKFGPYTMYERERRDKRLVFVTRERLQAFVDSFGIG
jgi:hypothetical protein